MTAFVSPPHAIGILYHALLEQEFASVLALRKTILMPGMPAEILFGVRVPGERVLSLLTCLPVIRTQHVIVQLLVSAALLLFSHLCPFCRGRPFPTLPPQAGRIRCGS